VKSCKRIIGSGGFSLIELIMIILILGILLPVVLAPFITASKSVGVISDIARTSYLARGNLSSDLACVDATWPSVGCGAVGPTGVYTSALSPVTEIVDGVTYTTTITGQFYASDMATAASGTTPNNKYLWITASTTDGSNTVSISAVKSRDYP